MDISAQLSYSDISAQKMRLVVDLVRGKPAQQAVNILTFTSGKAAEPLLKLLKSAISNAEKNMGIAAEQLYVHNITADEAPTRKWRRFGARGRFKPVLRRNSHVTVVLRQLEGLPVAPAAAPSKTETKAAPKPAEKAAKSAKPKTKAKAK